MKKKNVNKTSNECIIKNKIKLHNNKFKNINKCFISNTSFGKTSVKNRHKTLRQRLKERLKAARFRYLNEQFYISSSSDAKKYFSEHPEEFKAYHDGYKQQTSLWPKNPIHDVIEEFQHRLKSGKKEFIADFGCGEAKLAQSLINTNAKVFSFDLVAVNNHVTACDMAHTKLFSDSMDVVVFCLSLMESDISKFIKEANRVLKINGIMKIVEVQSRFENIEDFIKNIEKLGFNLVFKNLTHNLFYYFDFKKKNTLGKNKKKKLPEILLKPCLYKHR